MRRPDAPRTRLQRSRRPRPWPPTMSACRPGWPRFAWAWAMSMPPWATWSTRWSWRRRFPAVGEALFFAALATGDTAKAGDALEKIRAAQGQTEVVENLEGLYKLAQIDFAGARTIFSDLVEKHPDFNPAKINLARVTAMMGDSSGGRSGAEGYTGQAAGRPAGADHADRSDLCADRPDARTRSACSNALIAPIRPDQANRQSRRSLYPRQPASEGARPDTGRKGRDFERDRRPDPACGSLSRAGPAQGRAVGLRRDPEAGSDVGAGAASARGPADRGRRLRKRAWRHHRRAWPPTRETMAFIRTM